MSANMVEVTECWCLTVFNSVVTQNLLRGSLNGLLSNLKRLEYVSCLVLYLALINNIFAASCANANKPSLWFL